MIRKSGPFLCAVVFSGVVIAGLSQPASADEVHECGTILAPEEAARALADAWAYQGQATTRGAAQIYYVPLVFHVVRQSNGTGGLTPSQLCQGLDALDAGYAAANMRFYHLGAVDYIDSDAFYFNINTLAEINALRTTNLVPDAVNIYFTPTLDYESGALCGISAFTTSSVQSIAMRNSCMPPSNLSTLPHEVGHYFNLYHTHETAFGSEFVDGSNCTTAGDVVCDTPADPVLGSGNVTAAPACIYTGTSLDGHGQPYVPDTKNYMSYSLKACRDHFSLGQDTRAYDTLVNLRPELAHLSLPGPADCNANTIRDACDILSGTSADCDANGLPDECQPDCDLDGRIDACDILGDINDDTAVNGVDLTIFVDVLLGIDALPAHVQQSETNCDAAVNAADIPNFITAYLGG